VFPGTGFDHHWFCVAPYYAPIYYPRVATHGSYGAIDPLYYGYEDDFPCWRAAHASTHEILAQALPEKVIEEGGRLDGFLYFEKVDPHHETARLRFDAVNIENGDMFATIAIPFTIMASQTL
jgi:hypothetical protein